MDLNKFKSLSISNNSPIRRLRNRNIYCNINVTTFSSSCNKDTQSLSKTTSTITIDNASSCNVSAQCSSFSNSSECRSNSSISVNNNDDQNEWCNADEEDVANKEEEDILIQYSSEDSDDEKEDGNQEQNATERTELTLIETQRRCRKLYHEGYFYTIDGASKKAVGPKERLYWKCERTGSKSVPKCPGRAYSISLYEPVIITVLHNHESNPAKLACLQAVVAIKNKAKSSNDNPRSIIASCQTKLDEESSKEMIRSKNLTQMIHRIRNQRPEYQVNAATIADISSTIPPTLKVSYRDELFYFGNI